MNTWIKYLLACTVIFIGLHASAQDSKSQKQAAKAEEVKKMVENVSYVFKANFVTPQRGGGRQLTSDYDLTVSKDTINAYLPYFGRAYIAPTDPTEGGIKFKTTNFEYKAKSNKNGGCDIVIRPKDRNINSMTDVQTMRLSISQTGYASLNITSSNRDPISFDGYIEARK
jgi:hypothetical protein